MATKNVLKGRNIIDGVRSEFEKMIEKLSKANQMLNEQKEVDEKEISQLQDEVFEIEHRVQESNKMIENIQQNILT